MAGMSAFVLVLLLAAGPCLLLERKIARLSVALAIALPAVAAFLLVQASMPFAGVWSEAAVVLAAAAAAVPAGVAVAKLGRLAQQAKDASGARAVIKVALVMPLMFLLVVPIAWTLLGRVRFANDLAWDADGTIVGKARSSNHNLPMLVVRDDRGHDSEFVGVHRDFWMRANVGGRLHKVPGETTATLEGEPIEFVRSRGASRAYPEEPSRGP